MVGEEYRSCAYENRVQIEELTNKLKDRTIELEFRDKTIQELTVISE